MGIAKRLLEGVKVAALFGAVALVVWSMPENRFTPAQEQPGSLAKSDRPISAR